MSAILKPARFRARLVAWFKTDGRDLPWRRTRDPYAILVSEIMLQQTQVATVIDYYTRWMKRFPDFAALARASEAEVLHAWQGLGYYSRARNLHRASQIVMTTHGGRLPNDPESIQELPGVGRYTAGAVATFAFDQPTPIVDANIARVLARLCNWQKPIDSSGGREFLWKTAGALQPAKNACIFNSALMELGALVCTPQPKCPVCPVRAFCCAKQPRKLPIKKPRRKTIPLVEQCAWIVRRGSILLEQQTGTRWRGLWRLPALLESPGNGRLPPLLQIEYPFTHHRIRLSIFKQAPPQHFAHNLRWVRVSQIDDTAIPAPHRRALEELIKRKSRCFSG